MLVLQELSMQLLMNRPHDVYLVQLEVFPLQELSIAKYVKEDIIQRQVWSVSHVRPGFILEEEPSSVKYVPQVPLPMQLLQNALLVLQVTMLLLVSLLAEVVV
jgi:hypothetical protein